eukprot:56350-Eustigmatos_ZCMA.PRE.1
MSGRKLHCLWCFARATWCSRYTGASLKRARITRARPRSSKAPSACQIGSAMTGERSRRGTYAMD